MSRRQKLARYGFVAAVGVALGWLLTGPGSRPRSAGTWLRVEHHDLRLGIPTEGELRAVSSALIGPPQLARTWNFQISMIAEEGAEVERGQPVLGFDTTDLDQWLRRSRADADAAEKELEKAITDLDVMGRQLSLRLEEARARLRQTALKTAVSPEITAALELDKNRIDQRLAETEIAAIEALLEQHEVRRQMQLAILRSKIEIARNRVAEQQNAIRQMTVKAPRAGTTILRGDWRGRKKQVGDRVWRAEKVVEIPDLTAMEASAEVHEQAAGRLAKGQPVVFRLDTYPDREYRATVATIRGAVQRKSRQNPSKIVKLTLELEQTDTERMRPGMRLRGTIVAETIAGALAIPRGCLTTDEKGPYVEVAGLFGVRKVYPELGRRDQSFVEVLSGLAPGARVLHRAAAGDPA